MLLVPRPSIRPPRASAANNHDGGNERYVIPNLRNACRILKSLEQHPDGLKAADLARTLQIPVTTTLRIMTTLHREGFARKVEGRYELGPVLIQLGHAALAGTEIREQALPVLRELTESTDETSHVAIPCDERALIVAVQDSAHPLRAASGRRLATTPPRPAAEAPSRPPRPCGSSRRRDRRGRHRPRRSTRPSGRPIGRRGSGWR